MNYKIVRLNTAAQKEIEHSVLIIYTGGTLGMAYDDDGALVPFNFGKILEKIPNLNNLNISITVISFPEPIDSSNINLQHWGDMAYIIFENYDTYDGFVVLHGTDTMAYSASMLSFMLKGLNKPVIFTGAQLPISAMRSDARENLMTSLEIAISKANGKPIVPEVCIFSTICYCVATVPKKYKVFTLMLLSQKIIHPWQNQVLSLITTIQPFDPMKRERS